MFTSLLIQPNANWLPNPLPLDTNLQFSIISVPSGSSLEIIRATGQVPTLTGSARARLKPFRCATDGTCYANSAMLSAPSSIATAVISAVPPSRWMRQSGGKAKLR